MDSPWVRSVYEPPLIELDDLQRAAHFSLYTYQPLETNTTIRLLRLGSDCNTLPNSRTISQCEIVHYALTASPEYEALSYVWGDLQPGLPVLLPSNKFLFVTKNLYEALCALRPSAGHRLLWVDQICIHQQNLEERSSQVSRMAEIFERASRTVAWLGPEDDNAKRIHGLLGGLPEDIIHYTDLLGVTASPALGTVFTSHVDFEDARRRLDPEVRSLLIKEYLTFFERAWFRRLWIFQEMIVSKIILMHCGSLLFTWDRLVNFFFVICFTTVSDLETTNSLISIIMSAIAHRRKYQSGNPLNLLDILYNSAAHLECLNERDRIYAFMSLRGVREMNLPCIDYTKSIATVFQTTARALIKATDKLLLFTPPPCVGGITGLPSWVSDWTIPQGEPTLEFLDRSQFSASKQHKHRDRCPRNNNELVVFGRSVDAIDGVIEHAFEIYSRTDLHQHIPLQKLALLYYVYLGNTRRRLAAPLSIAVQSMALLVLRAVIADGAMRTVDSYLGRTGRSAPRSKPLTFPELSDLSTAWHESMDVPLKQEEEHLSRARRLRALLGPEDHHRLVFLRERSIGLVPKSARAGDTICLLHGISTPAVLRKAGTCYEYVGQCYIEGVMYGEACDWGEEEGDEFTLV
ncbi:hypothetical protein MMC27_000704 [Xylographa pallens]|nr:hypothetical protein [Xylographa pallens]